MIIRPAEWVIKLLRASSSLSCLGPSCRQATPRVADFLTAGDTGLDAPNRKKEKVFLSSALIPSPYLEMLLLLRFRLFKHSRPFFAGCLPISAPVRDPTSVLAARRGVVRLRSGGILVIFQDEKS